MANRNYENDLPQWGDLDYWDSMKIGNTNPVVDKSIASGVNKSYDAYNNQSPSWSDKIYDNGSGGKMKVDGYGSDALGFAGALGNMYMTNKGINAQTEQAEKEMAFQKMQYYQNMAMKMSDWRSNKNSFYRTIAKQNHGNAAGFDASKWTKEGTVNDQFGNKVNSPISNTNPNATAGVTPSPLWNQGATTGATPAPTMVASATNKNIANSNSAAGMPNTQATPQGTEAKKRNEKVINKVTA